MCVWTPNSAVAKLGLKNNDQILQIGKNKVHNWNDLTNAVAKSTSNLKKKEAIPVKAKTQGSVKTLKVIPKKS